MAVMGRPRKEVDWDEFDKLANLQCTLREISAWFEMCEDTLEARVKETHGVTFSEYLAQRSVKGKISLRRRQYQAAMSGNITMLIWLGKQWLGQSEKIETQNQSNSNSRLIVDLGEDE